jgi:predicted Zn-dependent protease
MKQFTLDDERELGRAVNRAILKLHPPLKVGPEPARLERAAELFLKARTRTALSYTLTVLDCPEANAFSHPGGYVYVCKGLFGLFAEDEDAALEFIVGHEIAHVDGMHMLNALQDPLWKDLKIGTSPLICSILLPQDHAEQQEFAADRWAWQMMNRAGRTRHQTLSFLRKWQARSLDEPFGNAPMTPDEEPAVDPIDNHLRGHVIPRARLKALEPFANPDPVPAPKPR